jgi:hypothetical protein
MKTLTDDAWARLQQILAERDPNGLFADCLAGPGAFRNRNGWERRTGSGNESHGKWVIVQEHISLPPDVARW